MHVLIFALLLIRALCFQHEKYYFASTLYPVDNIRRRDTVPLQIRRRTLRNDDNSNYRRIKDIREDGVDRRYEITEARLREAEKEIQREAEKEIQREARIESTEARRMDVFKNSVQHNLSENNINSAQEENYNRQKVMARDEDWRYLDEEKREFGRNIYNRNRLRSEQQRRLIK